MEIPRAGLLCAPTGRLRPGEARDCLRRLWRPNSALPDFPNLCRGLGPAGERKGFLHFLSGEGETWWRELLVLVGWETGRGKDLPGNWFPR